jgi:SAM-dependent MidA family methyltransferase
MSIEPPFRAIAEAIADHGPIGFDEYMELALYGPGGYYERPPVGPEGDFVTSPHVHPVFAELLARGIREVHAHLGAPTPFHVLEIGAGDGTLARQLLGLLGDLPLRYAAVERSGGARAALTALGGIQVHASVAQVPPPIHLVLGHEVLDNLPFRLVRGSDEIRVDLADGRLVEVATPAPDELAAPEGEDRAVPTGALALLADLAPRLAHAYALFVDYGSEAGSGGPVHGYRGHRIVEDVLAEPGATDITAGVDLGALGRAATALGLEVFPPTPQHRALARLGYAEWTRAELAAQAAMLNEGRGLEAVRTWAARSRASILVAPEQLGRLRWFCVAGRGLPAPSFLSGER